MKGWKISVSIISILALIAVLCYMFKQVSWETTVVFLLFLILSAAWFSHD